MEGEETALDRKTDRDDARRHDQHDARAGILIQHSDLMLHRDHQKVSRDVVHQHHAQKEKSRSHKVEDHVADRRQRRPSDLTHDQDAAAGKGQDLQKYIAGEDVVGPGHGHDRRCHQVQDRVIEIDLALVDILIHIAFAGQYRAEHNTHEQERYCALQDACPQFISPRRRKFAHHIRKGRPRMHREPEYRGCHRDEHALIGDRIYSCFFAREQCAEHA